ncbi:MAG: hypothetical protein QG641_669 [Candidatus Poribacteria bacterium]|nr:hypothetical protein [Candidatus Poribacteria bacterium]
MNENVTNIDNINIYVFVFFLKYGYCIIYATIMCHYRNSVKVRLQVGD